MSEGLRESCLSCGKKHIAKAIILLSESKLDYPLHKWLALGNLSEAEDELVNEYPKLANRIRQARIDIELGNYSGNLLDFIEELEMLENEEA